MILFLQGSSLKDLICFKQKFMLYSVCDFFSEKNINENYIKNCLKRKLVVCKSMYNSKFLFAIERIYQDTLLMNIVSMINKMENRIDYFYLFLRKH